MKALIKKNKIIRENYKNLELNYYIMSALYNNNILSLAKKELLERKAPAPLLRERLPAFAKLGLPSLAGWDQGLALPLGQARQASKATQATTSRGCGEVLHAKPAKISQIRNICVITGRTRAVVQKYKMSRIKFKQNAEAGLIPGIRKL